MTWVVILNSNECRVFSFSEKDKALTLLHQIQHPENKGRNEDMVSDRPGHYNSPSFAGGAYSPHTDPKDVKINQFAQQIDHLLNEGRTHNEYKELIVIAGPKMYGDLSAHMNKNVTKLITKHILKDVVFFNEREILELLLSE